MFVCYFYFCSHASASAAHRRRLSLNPPHQTNMSWALKMFAKCCSYMQIHFSGTMQSNTSAKWGGATRSESGYTSLLAAQLISLTERQRIHVPASHYMSSFLWYYLLCSWSGFLEAETIRRFRHSVIRGLCASTQCFYILAILKPKNIFP